jgi:nicotinamidase-related amidase
MTHRLIDPDECVLMLVDVQEGFIAKVDGLNASGFVERIAFLATAARFCDIPVVASVESPEQLGGLPPELIEAIDGAPVIRKEVFGLAGDPLVGPAVRATGRRTAVLVGLETDVCVAQSALGLLDEGLTVVVVEDAVASPGNAHGAGLDRMRRAGAIPVVAKQLFYEWMRTVKRAEAFSASHPAFVPPPGVTL